MDWLLELASKVGGSVFIIAFIIFLAFIFYIIGLLVKHRKNIKGAIESWIEREKEKEELKKTVEQHKEDIEALKRKTDTYCDNRVHDREQSFVIQKQLNTAIETLSQKLDDMTERENERQRAKLKDRIGEMYSYFHESQKWNHMQKEALTDLITAYEKAGGLNSYVHEIVQPESYTWELID